MRVLKYDPISRRTWVLGQRIHHGAVGVICVGVGLILAVHDRADVRYWFARGDLQEKDATRG